MPLSRSNPTIPTLPAADNDSEQNASALPTSPRPVAKRSPLPLAAARAHKRARPGWNLLSLPHEIILHMMIFLALPDIARLSQTNQELYNISSDPILLARFYDSALGGPTPHSKARALRHTGQLLHSCFPLRPFPGAPPSQGALRQRLLYAVSQRHHALVRRTLELGASPIPEALLMATTLGDDATVHLLLQAGVPANASDARGVTALWTAAAGGHVRCVHMLLDAGALPHTAPAGGSSALHVAAAGGHTPVMEALLAADADVDAVDVHLETPLCAAAACNQPGAVSVLLEHGANVNAVRVDGSSPLLVSLRAGSVAAAHVLLAAGADPSQSDWEGGDAFPLLGDHPLTLPMDMPMGGITPAGPAPVSLW